jgi:uncharacterized protein with PIN domain
MTTDEMTAETAECPTCKKRSLLRAVVDTAQALLAEPERHEHPEFMVCPVCGWNNLPERWEQTKLR